MKTIRLITASFGDEKRELEISAPLYFKGYWVSVFFYRNNNTLTRQYNLSPRAKSRIPKIMEWYDHPGFDYYIWLDSKYTTLDGFLEMMMEFDDEDDADICLFKHTERSSVNEEVSFVKEGMASGDNYLLRKFDGEVIEDKLDKYLLDPDFEDRNLFDTSIFMYSKSLIQNPDYNLLTDWMLHCMMYNINDHIWLPYLLHKHKVSYKVYSKSLRDCAFVTTAF